MRRVFGVRTRQLVIDLLSLEISWHRGWHTAPSLPHAHVAPCCIRILHIIYYDCQSRRYED